jgi:hypothetical protein
MNNQIMSHTTQISDIIQGINTNPRGQNIIIAICVLNMIATGFVGFGVAYYYPTPKFQCREEITSGTFGNWGHCNEDDYCSTVKINSALGRYMEDALHTWTYTYNLYCDRAYLRNISSFIFWGGGGALNLFLMMFVDTLGRKLSMVLSNFLIILALVPVFFVDEIWTKTISMAIAFAGSDCVFTITFIYLAEILTLEYRNYCGVWMWCAFSLGEILLACVMFGTKTDILPILVTGGLVAMCTLLFVMPIFPGTAMWCPETPLWLLNQKRYPELKKVLKGMAVLGNTKQAQNVENPNPAELITPITSDAKLETPSNSEVDDIGFAFSSKVPDGPVQGNLKERFISDPKKPENILPEAKSTGDTNLDYWYKRIENTVDRISKEVDEQKALRQTLGETVMTRRRTSL